LNIQVERQENHTARVTVALEAERFEAAKQRAARKLSNRLNVPGFRKGKAPYRVIVNYVGEAAIIEEAVDLLGEEVYKETLPETGVTPYGPGSLDEVQMEKPTDVPTLVYSIPLQPEVDLGEYRSIRRDFNVPSVEDKMVDRAMRVYQEQNALIEESTRPAELGNRVTLDIHSFYVEAHENVEHEHADGEEHDHEHDHDGHDHGHGEHFIYENDFQTILNDDYEPMAGFNAQIVGLSVGDKKEFELTFPADDEIEEDRGKTVKFEVTVKKIETFTAPPLNDELAARVTAEEEKPLTLLELRMRTRKDMEEMNERRYRSQYASEVLEQIVENATIHYPEMVVTEEIERTIERFDQQLRQQSRLTVQDYLTITKSKLEDLYAQFRPGAVRTVERALTMRELLLREGVTVSAEEVDEAIEKIVSSYPEENRATIRPLFDRPEMRESILDDLLTDKLMERIALIGRGEAPELTEAPIADTAGSAASTDAESAPASETSTESSSGDDNA